MSISIVGVGACGRHVIPLLKHYPDVHRLAPCNLSSARLAQCAKEFPISEMYDSLDQICRSDRDALVTITQHWLHGPQVIQALEWGKHVYSAVPVAYRFGSNTDQIPGLCDKLVETVKCTGLFYMRGAKRGSEAARPAAVRSMALSGRQDCSFRLAK